MIRLHATRLMAAGEFALWHDGRIVWRGNVGACIGRVAFDAVSFAASDFSRMKDLIGDQEASPDVLRAAIAGWWG